MHIDRRTAIRSFLALSAGVVFLPSCMQDAGKPSIVLINLVIDKQDEDLLAEVCEALIPRTGTPGAKDISAHLFVLKMLDDCTPKAEQEKIVKGLRELNNLCSKEYGKTFIQSGPEQKQALFSKIEANQGMPNEVAGFYTAVKKLTIQAYTTSKYYLTEVHVYELVPGRFHGCVPVAKANSI